MARQRVYGHYYAAVQPLQSCVGSLEPVVPDPYAIIEEEEFERNIFKNLNQQESDVVSLLLDGLDFVTIALMQGIKLSEIYKVKTKLMEKFAFLNGNRPISLRVRNKKILIKNLLWFYFLVHPEKCPLATYQGWEMDPVLKEHKKPPYNLIKEVFELCRAEFV